MHTSKPDRSGKGAAAGQGRRLRRRNFKVEDGGSGTRGTGGYFRWCLSKAGSRSGAGYPSLLVDGAMHSADSEKTEKWLSVFKWFEELSVSL